MPVDDRLKCLNNPQTANGFVSQHRLGGVAKSETANHDVQLTPVVILLRVIGKAKRAKGNFLCGEKIRHQVLIAKHNLKDIRFQSEIMAAAQ